MFAPVWTRVAKRLYRNTDEVIQGYARFKVSGEEYPAAVATPDHPSSRLQGRVYWDIDSEDMRRLDQFEGADYSRVNIKTERGHEVALYVYRSTQRMSQEPWDPVWFERTGMTSFLTRYPGFE